MNATELIHDAERLCEEADNALFAERQREADRLTRKAIRLYREAARLAAEPERGRLLLRAAELAEVIEAPKAVVSIVREACGGDPDYETVEALRGLWECHAWAAGHDDPPPFPEPAPSGSRTLLDRKGPLPGQGELFGA